ncbi:MAG: toll/interleukin-1 receptor domain-containing protein [Bacteroidota bacterium]|jgi:hypothetical protein
MKYRLPQLKIDAAQRIWLQALYEIFRKQETRTVRELKAELLGKIPVDFDPGKIDWRLAPGGRNLTILGLAHVNPDDDNIQFLDDLLRAIQNYVRKHPNVDKISLSAFPTQNVMGDQEKYRILELVRDFVSPTWHVLVGKDQEQNLVYEINLGGEPGFDFFYQYDGLENFIKKKLEPRSEPVFEQPQSQQVESRNVLDSTFRPSRWDAFISYASEDREVIAAPLAILLRGMGISVWFDQTELNVGDSLRQKIDEGLANSKFGIVLLSPHFFGKHYPTRELDGLAQREANGQKLILPVWHNVDVEQVRAFSPPLADRIAAKWQDGIHVVARKLIKVIRPDILETVSHSLKAARLSLIGSGSQLAKIIGGAEASLIFNEELKNETEIELVASFLDSVRDWIDIWDDIGVKAQAEAQLGFNQQIDDLRKNGWSVWGSLDSHRYHIPNAADKSSIDFNTCTLAVVRGTPVAVIRNGDGVVVVK